MKENSYKFPFLSLVIINLIIMFIIYIILFWSLLLSTFCYVESFSLLSDISQSFALMPWFVTGFADTESCFSVSILRNPTTRLGWQVQLEFQRGAVNNSANLKLLEDFKSFFGRDRII